MRATIRTLVAAAGLLGLCQAAAARQARQPSQATVASVMNQQLTIVEQQFVSAAEAMPADKYSFVPSGGNFGGVRTFAQQVKHVATVNYLFYSALIGQNPPAAVTANKQTNGPDSIRSKAQILKYLKDSFTFAHQAISTITASNATALLPRVSRFGVPSFLNTRLALASFGSAHAFDHYGQIVEYLRMNGIAPPASRGQPPANPGSRASGKTKPR